MNDIQPSDKQPRWAGKFLDRAADNSSSLAYRGLAGTAMSTIASQMARFFATEFYWYLELACAVAFVVCVGCIAVGTLWWGEKDNLAGKSAITKRQSSKLPGEKRKPGATPL